MAAPQAFNVSVRPAATQDRKGLNHKASKSSPSPYIPMPEGRGFTATFGNAANAAVFGGVGAAK